MYRHIYIEREIHIYNMHIHTYIYIYIYIYIHAYARQRLATNALGLTMSSQRRRCYNIIDYTILYYTIL